MSCSRHDNAQTGIWLVMAMFAFLTLCAPSRAFGDPAQNDQARAVDLKSAVTEEGPYTERERQGVFLQENGKLRPILEEQLTTKKSVLTKIVNFGGLFSVVRPPVFAEGEYAKTETEDRRPTILVDLPCDIWKIRLVRTLAVHADQNPRRVFSKKKAGWLGRDSEHLDVDFTVSSVPDGGYWIKPNRILDFVVYAVYLDDESEPAHAWPFSVVLIADKKK